MTENFLNLLADIESTYRTDIIFIVGKGQSADSVAPEVFNGSLTIGVNDSERIAPIDISIFHGTWVVNGLKESGFKSRLYVTSVEFDPSYGQVYRAPHVRLTQESSDLVMQRLLDDDIYVEDLLFLSALKIARFVAKLRGRPQTVYMVGFDFSTAAGYSQRLQSNYAPNESDELDTRIPIQEFYFIHTLYFLKESNLNVVHVGNRAFSALSAEGLNSKFISTTNFERENFKVSVVAELTTNHFGDRGRLSQMIRAAASAGADYIKLQKRNVETFYSKKQLNSTYKSPFGATFGDYRRALELSREDFEFVDSLCRQLKIKWFASLLDIESFYFMMQFNPELLKLPSTISEHKDYLESVSRSYSGAVVISTGMTDQTYEEWVLATFSTNKNIYLMQANSAYPTPLHDCNIGVVRHYYKLAASNPRIIPAYSSHDHGSKASTLAVAAGARMIEKHVKLGNTEWAHFDAVAMDLTLPDFKIYIDSIREAEAIVGEEGKRVNPSEHHKYKLIKR